jgi:hypothetical protein
MSRSSGCQSQAMRSACTPANSERCVWTAPFGLTGGARGVDDQRVVPGRAASRRPDAGAGAPGDEQLGRGRHGAPRIDLFHALPGRRPIDQGGRRAGVALQVGQFAPRRRGIDGDDDGPQAQRAQEPHNGVHRRRAAPQDPVPRLDPPIGQVRRRQGGPFRQGAGPQEARGIAPVHEGRSRRVAVPVGGPHPGERPPSTRSAAEGPGTPNCQGPPHAMV